MLTIQRLNSRGQNKAGVDVVDYLIATESIHYYHDGVSIQGAPTMRWCGQLAHELGLSDKPVEKDDMMALAQGFAPDGTPLCQNAGQVGSIEVKRNRQGQPILRDDGTEMTIERGGHRVGFDMTLTLPKSVGIFYAMADDKARQTIQELMMESAAVISKFAEGKIETRRGKGGKDVIGVEGTVVSHHFHEATRNLEPHPHVHMLFYNVCKGVDGEYSTYDSNELFRWRHAMGVLGENHFASRFKEIFNVSIHQEEIVDVDNKRTGKRYWEIEGLHDRDLIEALSSRHLEIRELKAQGLSDKDAWSKSRKHKDEPSHAELVEHFKGLIEDLSHTHDIPRIEELTKRKDDVVKARTEAELWSFLHQKQSVIDQQTLLKHIGLEGLGVLSSDEMLAMWENMKASQDAIEIDPMAVHEQDKGAKLSKVHTEKRYAARWMLGTELRFVESAKQRLEETWLQVDKATADDIIERVAQRKGFKPSDEQYRAIQHACVESAGIAVVPGFAGTGKTATGDFIKNIFEAEGRTMIGCAVGNKAAKKLQNESGIVSRSVTKTLAMIEKGELVLDRNTVMVLDESGMINIHQSKALTDACKASGAKLLVQGDTRQLQPVGAGMGMSLLEDVLPSSELTEIRRQKDAVARRIAMMFYDAETGKRTRKNDVMSRDEVVSKSRKIFDALDRMGCIEEYSNRSDGLLLLARDYMSKNVPDNEFLILAHTHADLKDCNDTIREARKQVGLVSGLEASFKAKGAEGFVDITLAKGDPISFTTADSVMNVINGTEAVVHSVVANTRKGGYDITVRMDEDQRELTFNTYEWKAVKLNYARTVHDSQGQGKSQIRLWGNPGMVDVSSFGVAYTRMTEGSFKVYLDAEDADFIRDNNARERFTENILQAGVRDQSVAQRYKNMLKSSDPLFSPDELQDIAGQSSEQEVAVRRTRSHQR